ncbi:MAG: serine hydrolase [Chloroflexi bacterium]|nr:serine hydrolase [Chloroflexota bacterium]
MKKTIDAQISIHLSSARFVTLLLVLFLFTGCTSARATAVPTFSPVPVSPTATLVPAATPSLIFTPTSQSTCNPRSTAYWPTEEWQISPLEGQGIDSVTLGQLSEKVGDDVAFLVVQGGYIVAEHYPPVFHSRYLHHIHSCTKSVTSILVGIAMQEGYIGSVDDAILDYFPEYEFANMDERKEAITLHHILSMSSGLDWGGGIGGSDVQSLLDSPDWTQYTLDRPMAHEPGEVFSYNSGGTQLLSAIIQRETSQTTEAYAREKLFEPIGISDYRWNFIPSPQSITPGAWGLFLTARDMARIGYLYLNEGCWDREQIVPQDWVRSSASVQITRAGRNFDYGYQWWVPTQDPNHTYVARGWYGDHYAFIHVISDLDVVIVFAGGEPDDDAVAHIVEALEE